MYTLRRPTTSPEVWTYLALYIIQCRYTMCHCTSRQWKLEVINEDDEVNRETEWNDVKYWWTSKLHCSVYSASVARVWRYKNLIITITITTRHGRVSYETEMLWSDEGRVPAHIALCLRNSDIAGKPRGRHINAYACSGVADHRKRLYRTCVTLPNFVILRLRL